MIKGIFKKTDNKKHNELVEKLYKENYMYFYKVAYSILKNNSDAEDAVNDAFIKTYRYIEKFSEKNCPKPIPLIVSIVKSVSFNIKKRQGKLLFSEYSDEIIDSVAFSGSEDYIIDEIISKENLEILLSVLTEEEKEMLELKVINGLTFKELASKIGLSHDVTRKKYQRMIKKLRDREERRLK